MVACSRGGESGAHLAFLDESGFLVIPNVRKTWAPVGHTPCLRHSYRRDRVSVISALTVAPHRRHLGLYFDPHVRNITGTEVITFLRELLRHLRGEFVLLWDGGKIHRRRDVQAFLRRPPRVQALRFPGYAPELNPDEFIWTQAKRELPNIDHDGSSRLRCTSCDPFSASDGRRPCFVRASPRPIFRDRSPSGQVFFRDELSPVEAVAVIPAASRCVAWWARWTLLGNSLNTQATFQGPGGGDRDIQVSLIG